MNRGVRGLENIGPSIDPQIEKSSFLAILKLDIPCPMTTRNLSRSLCQYLTNAHKVGTRLRLFAKNIREFSFRLQRGDLFCDRHSESLSMVYHVIGNTSQER